MMLDILNDTDWHEVFGYAGEEADANSAGSAPAAVEGASCSAAPFTREDVAEVQHTREGEPDERDWLIVGRLHDGRWFYIEAGCDYTGWNCQACGSAWVADTYEQLVQFGLTDQARDAWGL